MNYEPVRRPKSRTGMIHDEEYELESIDHSHEKHNDSRFQTIQSDEEDLIKDLEPAPKKDDIDLL